MTQIFPAGVVHLGVCHGMERMYAVATYRRTEDGILVPGPDFTRLAEFDTASEAQLALAAAEDARLALEDIFNPKEPA